MLGYVHIVCQSIGLNRLNQRVRKLNSSLHFCSLGGSRFGFDQQHLLEQMSSLLALLLGDLEIHQIEHQMVSLLPVLSPWLADCE